MKVCKSRPLNHAGSIYLYPALSHYADLGRGCIFQDACERACAVSTFLIQSVRFSVVSFRLPLLRY